MMSERAYIKERSESHELHHDCKLGRTHASRHKENYVWMTKRSHDADFVVEALDSVLREGLRRHHFDGD